MTTRERTRYRPVPGGSYVIGASPCVHCGQMIDHHDWATGTCFTESNLRDRRMATPTLSVRGEQASTPRQE